MVASTSRQARRIAFVLATSLLVATRADPNAPCYFPGENHALGYYPCQPDAFIASCCPAGWTCFSNALCIATTESNSFPNITLGAVQRGACTNPKWNNNICGSACLDPDNNDAGKLAACGNDRFCCGADFDSGRCNCSSNGAAFRIDVGLAQTIIQVTDTTFKGTPSLSIATTPPTARTTTSPASVSARPSSIMAATLSTARLGSSNTSAVQSSTPWPSFVHPPYSESGPNRGLVIGLAVGIPVGVIAIVAFVLVYIFHWRPHSSVRSGGSGTSGHGMFENNNNYAGTSFVGGGGHGVGNNSSVIGNDDFNNTSLQLAESDLNGPQIVSNYRSGGV
ncbi:hypothetical protein B0H63DRAFT_62077 [Podospora didyma]|uniref:Mid2 domain-containing protein n=1 Tax=Podospora didyma TaxID=330526 RepID=A0AAE0U8H3_9PEZI|nr:hypothetical protein B0H63DRAFT_62077 [Podospora didyma]